MARDEDSALMGAQATCCSILRSNKDSGEADSTQPWQSSSLFMREIIFAIGPSSRDTDYICFRILFYLHLETMASVNKRKWALAETKPCSVALISDNIAIGVL